MIGEAIVLALVGLAAVLAVWDMTRRALNVQAARAAATAGLAEATRTLREEIAKERVDVEATRKDVRAIRDQLGTRR